MVARKQAVILRGRTIILRTNPVDPHSLFRGDYAQLTFDINQLNADKWSPWPPRIGSTVYTELRQNTTSWLVVGPLQNIPVEMPSDHVVLKGKITGGDDDRNGHEVFDLQDFSHPGWLQTQPSTATWRNERNWIGRHGIWLTGRLSKEGQPAYACLKTYNGKDWQLSDVRENNCVSSDYPPEFQRVLTGRLGPLQSERVLRVEYGIESYFIPEGMTRNYQLAGLDAEIIVDKNGNSILRRVAPQQK